MEWQPIESAERDDAWVLLFVPTLRTPVRVGFWREHEERWGFLGNTGVKNERANPPTHWQPLPNPPAA